jgi:DNA repair protein RecO (recombination protein O)
MSIINTEAIVLKCTNFRETSKIVTFYTKSHGKLRGIAKGVRSSKTKWGGVLQSMAYLNLFFYFKENKDLHLPTLNMLGLDLFTGLRQDAGWFRSLSGEQNHCR